MALRINDGKGLIFVLRFLNRMSQIKRNLTNSQKRVPFQNFR